MEREKTDQYHLKSCVLLWDRNFAHDGTSLRLIQANIMIQLENGGAQIDGTYKLERVGIWSWRASVLLNVVIWSSQESIVTVKLSTGLEKNQSVPVKKIARDPKENVLSTIHFRSAGTRPAFYILAGEKMFLPATASKSIKGQSLFLITPKIL